MTTHAENKERQPRRGAPTKLSMAGPVTGVHLLRMANDDDDDDDVCVATTTTLGSFHVVVLVGRGPWLECYTCCHSAESRREEPSYTTSVLVFSEGGTIHGIREGSGRRGVGDGNHPSCCRLLMVFGGRRLGIVDLQRPHSRVELNPYSFDSSSKRTTTTTTSTTAKNGLQRPTSSPATTTTTWMEVSDWIWDVRLLDMTAETTSTTTTAVDSDQQEEEQRLEKYGTGDDTTRVFWAALGLAHNQVEIWKFKSFSNEKVVGSATKLWILRHAQRCVTGCLSFWGWESTTETTTTTTSSFLEPLLVAAGTVFSPILVWTALTALETREILLEETETEEDVVGCREKSDFETTSLHGHEGVVFSCCFSKNATFLASTSDDRTVRLWKRSTDCSFTLQWTAYAHSARVWDCALVGGGGDEVSSEEDMVVSVAEDGTVRLWSLASGPKSLAVLRGHHGRGAKSCNIWKVCALNQRRAPLILTGGNDGTACLWNVDRALQFHGTSTPATITTATSTAERSDNRTPTTIPPALYQVQVPLETTHETTRTTTTMTSLTSSSSRLPDDDEDAEVTHKEASESAAVPPQEPSSKRKKTKSQDKNAAGAIIGMKFYTAHSKGKSLLVAQRGGGLLSFHIGESKWMFHPPWYSTRANEAPPTGSCLCVHPSNLWALVGTTRGQFFGGSLANIHNKNDDDTKEAYSPIKQITLVGDAGDGTLPRLVAMQSMQWIDHQDLLVCYIKGIVVLWHWNSDAQVLVQQQVFAMGTNAVPMSMVVDHGQDRLFVGDSRGNIALFDMATTRTVAEPREPLALVPNVHHKEHVTDMVLLSPCLLSAGNDGCLVETVIRDNGETQLIKGLSLAVASLTGITHLWRCGHSGNEKMTIAGGYHGNDFVVWNVTVGCQLLRLDTGGRQRRLEASMEFVDSSFWGCTAPSFSSCTAVCWTSPAAQSWVLLQAPLGPNNNTAPATCPFGAILGFSGHCESITSVRWMWSRRCRRPSSSGCSQQQMHLMVSGANDCTSKISLYSPLRRQWRVLQELSLHESCVRCVCVSSRQAAATTCLPQNDDDEETILVVTCGGKLGVFFYSVVVGSRSNGSLSNTDEEVRLQVYPVGINRLGVQPAMDHRMNVIEALALEWEDATTTAATSAGKCPYHLVVGGDSNGDLHIHVVSDKVQTPNAPRHVQGHTLGTQGRPILSLALVRPSRDWIVALVGTTAGDVTLWALPGSIRRPANNKDKRDKATRADSHHHNLQGCLSRDLPQEFLHRIPKVHQMGVNAMSACVLSSLSASSCAEESKVDCIVCTGGDDQQLGLHVLELQWCLGGMQCTKVQSCPVVEGCSFSAYKSVQIVPRSPRELDIFAVTMEQSVTQWHYRHETSPWPMTRVARLPVDVSSVSSLDCCVILQQPQEKEEMPTTSNNKDPTNNCTPTHDSHEKKDGPDNGSTILVAIGGEGLEFMTFLS